MPNYQEFLHVFCGQFVLGKRIKKRLRGDGNAKERWKIPSEDACKEVLAHILEGDCLELQKLALFLLCRFLRFWLRFAAITGIISRVFWWTMQRCLNPVLKRWFLQERRIHLCECALGQNWWKLQRNHSRNAKKRCFQFGDFCTLTTLCGDCFTCNVYKTLTSWRKKLPRISPATC